jgi:hypothetical protein
LSSLAQAQEAAAAHCSTLIAGYPGPDTNEAVETEYQRININ